jgi:hypothetical protein
MKQIYKQIKQTNMKAMQKEERGRIKQKQGSKGMQGTHVRQEKMRMNKACTNEVDNV